jgi:hypothetical protein
MSKLINLIHPYEVSSIKNINDFYIILKNILRLSSKRILEKKDGILIPVRWSKNKNCWVVDRGTDLYRDIEGIEKNNIDVYYNRNEILYKAILFTLNELENKSLENLFENYNLKKNESKFFAFEYCNHTTNIIENTNECLYSIGLFQRCQTKKRKGIFSKNKKSILLDNSIETLQKVSHFNSRIFCVNSYKIKNYLEVYKSFYSEISNKSYVFKLKDCIREIKVNSISNSLLSHKSSHKEILSFINNSEEYISESFDKIKVSVFLYLIYFDFVKFIKKNLKINSENFEGFVVPDNVNHIFYKVTGNFILKVFIKNNTFCKKELLPPLLPCIF